MLNKNIGCIGFLIVFVGSVLLSFLLINNHIRSLQDSEEYPSLSSIMNSKADILSDLGITKISAITTGMQVSSSWCEGDYTVTNELGPFTAILDVSMSWVVYAEKGLKSKNSLTEAKERFAYTLNTLVEECEKSVVRQATWLDLDGPKSTEIERLSSSEKQP